MDGFRVWVQPMDYDFRVSVDGVANTHWLLERLSRAFVFKNASPLEQSAQSALCTFQVPCNALLSFPIFRKLLIAMPEVSLVMQPALA
jgi:hypothetical protein